MAEDVDLDEYIMSKDDLSGADIKAICTEAGLLALRERRMKVCSANVGRFVASLLIIPSFSRTHGRQQTCFMCKRTIRPNLATLPSIVIFFVWSFFNIPITS